MAYLKKRIVDGGYNVPTSRANHVNVDSKVVTAATAAIDAISSTAYCPALEDADPVLSLPDHQHQAMLINDTLEAEEISDAEWAEMECLLPEDFEEMS